MDRYVFFLNQYGSWKAELHLVLTISLVMSNFLAISALSKFMKHLMIITNYSSFIKNALNAWKSSEIEIKANLLLEHFM